MTRRILLAAALLALVLILLGKVAEMPSSPFPHVGACGLGMNTSCLVRIDLPGPYLRPWIWVHKPSYWFSDGLYDVVPVWPPARPPARQPEGEVVVGFH